MQVTHQIGDDFLAAYAAGQLPEAFDLVVASHLSLCPPARERYDALEALGGTVLESAPEAEMSAGSLEATLARIAGGASPQPELARTKTCDVLPAPLRDYVGGSIESVKWRPVGMGVKQAILPMSDGASARLLYIPGGAEMPDHGHGGLEMTLVLKGAFLDGADRFGRGDVEIGDEDLVHHPVAEAGEPCICLAATDAPLKFSGWLPRLVQPFLKI
ncbi:ChrR family anti-sigma-E factor [Tropicimonas sp. IMCC6043]|uniref:ChrR family anti-sigma-E factor n=1 Tax=Tropicimonas sp. IMCC6043 TaxID=2510645 RepID=UPI00101D96F2|nr:ChrR family anti-sigma-E factor [Tropicimonas sp. IMCC6043]RYH09651.1 transcriptional regulator [Tropicimonas sp. IMCC6043]